MYDLVIRNGTLVEGSGPPGYRADVAIEDGRIAEISDLSGRASFREYLDVVDTQPKGINYASNIGHSALRTFVMGEAAFERTSSDDELALMRRELEDALAAGAIGFTTSRGEGHLTSDDRPVASRMADWMK